MTMTVDRWDPVRDLRHLRERVDTLFRDVLGRAGNDDATESPGTWRPPVDVWEEGDTYQLRVDLPGVAAGDVSVKEDLLKGRQVGDRSYKVHLDGYDLLPALKGEGTWPRQEFIYWTDDGNVAALRYGNWKATFLVQRAHGLHVWQEPFVPLRLPRLFNIRSDPFEEAESSWENWKWRVDRAFLLVPAQQYVGKFLATFKEFPPSQKVGSFSLDQDVDESGASAKYSDGVLELTLPKKTGSQPSKIVVR